PQGVGEGRVRDKREAPGFRPLDRLWDIRHDIAHMVHNQRVLRDVAGVAGLNELRFYLAEMHKGIAPTAGDRTTTVHRATTGVCGPEPVLEPRDGLVQVSYQVANVLNLVKHTLSFTCRVYDANVRCAPRALSRRRPRLVRGIIDPFALRPKP